MHPNFFFFQYQKITDNIVIVYNTIEILKIYYWSFYKLINNQAQTALI